MGINGVAKHDLSHVMGLKTNFGLRKPFSHFGISVLREKVRARACGERRCSTPFFDPTRLAGPNRIRDALIPN